MENEEESNEKREVHIFSAVSLPDPWLPVVLRQVGL